MLGRDLIVKLRILSIAFFSGTLLLGFLNCSGATSLLSDVKTQTTAQNDPSPQADPPPDSLGGIEPGEQGTSERFSAVPVCFNMIPVGPEDLLATESVFKAQLTSSNLAPVIVDSGKLILAKGKLTTEIASLRVDGEAGEVEFVILKDQLNSVLVSGMFSGPGYSVLIPVCVE